MKQDDGSERVSIAAGRARQYIVGIDPSIRVRFGGKHMGRVIRIFEAERLALSVMRFRGSIASDISSGNLTPMLWVANWVKESGRAARERPDRTW